MTNGPNPSGMKVWVIQPGKEPQPAEEPAEDKGNMKWAMEEDSFK